MVSKYIAFSETTTVGWDDNSRLEGQARVDDFPAAVLEAKT
jgi:hypothetical protein